MNSMRCHRGLCALLLIFVPLAEAYQPSGAVAHVDAETRGQLRHPHGSEPRFLGNVDSHNADRPGVNGSEDTLSTDKETLTQVRSAASYIVRQVLHIPENIDTSAWMDSISWNVTYGNIWEELETYPERRPFGFSILVATTKNWLADAVVQLGSWRPAPLHAAASSVEKWSFSWRRSFAFALFGLLYGGLGEWFFYVDVFSTLCPHAIRFSNEPVAAKLADEAGQLDLVRQVLYDNFILNPLVYFPLFYAIKYSVVMMTRSDSKHDDNKGFLPRLWIMMIDGMAQYKKNFFSDNMHSLCIWLPGDAIVYSAPMWMRMPLGHFLGFVWAMFLSHNRGSGNTPAPETEPASKEGCSVKKAQASF